MSSSGKLTVTLTSGTVINLGNIKGTDGIGITRSEIDSNGCLLLTFSDGTVSNLGNVVGAKGADGIGISEVKILTDGTLTLTLSDGTTKSLGNVKGEKGEDGAKGEKGETGRGIEKTEIIDGYLWVTYTDDLENPVNVGKTSEKSDIDCFQFTRLDDGTLAVSIKADYKELVEELTIPSYAYGKAVTQIANSGFSGCSYLRTLTIPSTITTIGAGAFQRCINLKLTIPASIKEIGAGAFYAMNEKSLDIDFGDISTWKIDTCTMAVFRNNEQKGCTQNYPINMSLQDFLNNIWNHINFSDAKVCRFYDGTVGPYQVSGSNYVFMYEFSFSRIN